MKHMFLQKSALAFLMLIISYNECTALIAFLSESVIEGDDAVLNCGLELDNDTLYSVKWYKAKEEFFRYNPAQSPEIMLFPVIGVKVDLIASSAREVKLKDVSTKSAGVYTCEVASGDNALEIKEKSKMLKVLSKNDLKNKFEGPSTSTTLPDLEDPSISASLPVLDVNNKFEDISISPPLPFLKYHENSYYIGNIVNLNFLEAGRFCNLIHMELVTIESAEENDFLFKHIRDTNAGSFFWTGGSNLMDGVHWYWLPSGQRVKYANWLKSPQDAQSGHCISVEFKEDDDLYWNDNECAIRQNFICKAPTSSISKWTNEGKIGSSNKVSIIKQQTNPLKTEVKEKKYKIGREKVTYEEAMKKCEDLGLKLVSIQNRDKQNAISKLVESNNHSIFWTSGYRLTEKVWRWVTGDAIKEFFWLEGEPSNDYGIERCLEVRPRGSVALWNDAPCESLKSYICESSEEIHNCQNCDNNINGKCESPVFKIYIDNKLQ